MGEFDDLIPTQAKTDNEFSDLIPQRLVPEPKPWELGPSGKPYLGPWSGGPGTPYEGERMQEGVDILKSMLQPPVAPPHFEGETIPEKIGAGLLNTAGGLYSSIVSPVGLATLPIAATRPGLAAISAAAGFSGANRLGEAISESDIQKGTEGLAELGLAGLGARQATRMKMPAIAEEAAAPTPLMESIKEVPIEVLPKSTGEQIKVIAREKTGFNKEKITLDSGATIEATPKAIDKFIKASEVEAKPVAQAKIPTPEEQTALKAEIEALGEGAPPETEPTIEGWPWPNKSNWATEILRELPAKERSKRSQFLGLKKADGSWETAPAKIASVAEKRFEEAQSAKPSPIEPEKAAETPLPAVAAVSEAKPEVVTATPEPPAIAEGKTEPLISQAKETTPEVQGMGGAIPSEFARGQGSPTAMRYARLDEIRAERGLEPLTKSKSVSDQAVMNKAIAEMDKNPAAGEQLVASILEKPRVIEDWENHLLLLREIDLRNEFQKSAREARQAYEDSLTHPERLADMERANAQTQYWSNEMSRNEKASKLSGSRRGSALRSLRVMANEDYSLAGLETQKIADRGFTPVNEKGELVTPQERRELQTIADKWEKANKDLDAAAGNEKKAIKAEFEMDKIKKEVEKMRVRDKQAGLGFIESIPHRTRATFQFLRTLRTSFDISAPGRQGKNIAFTNPILWAKTFKPMLEAAASPEKRFEITREIMGRPNAKSGLYDASGLHLPEGGALSSSEEMFMSQLAENIPGVPASERAYSTFLLKLRADKFDEMAAVLSRGPKPTIQEGKLIANFVNAATGRGAYPQNLAGASALLSGTFFAPRNLVARFQYLLGEPLIRSMIKGTPRTTKLIAWEYLKALTGRAIFYSLIGLASAGLGVQVKIESDPRSTNFGKIKVGPNTWLDPMGGMAQVAVFLSRFLSGQKKTQKGHIVPLTGRMKYGQEDTTDLLKDFLKGKLSPIASAAVDISTVPREKLLDVTEKSGSGFAGKPISPLDVGLSTFTPMIYEDVKDILKDNKLPQSLLWSLLSAEGENVQVYDQDRNKR